MLKRIAALLAAAVIVSGCLIGGQYRTLSEYCAAKPQICMLFATAIVAGAVLIIRNNNNDDHHAPVVISDIRVKEDIRHAETLENGIRLHAFRYKGDHRLFVGVLAQEILELPQHAHAVVQLESGYYAIDYQKLGLEILGAGEMQDASDKVLSGN